MTEEEIRNDERLLILNSMGGDTYARETITRQELLADLNSLSNLERMSGMYYIIKHLYPNKELQRVLSEVKDDRTFVDICRVFIAGMKHDKNN